MKCKQCDIDKDLDKFYTSNTKFGYDKVCKQCRSENQKNKPVRKSKVKKIKYRPTKKLINPEHPIPIKLTNEDGFGGKWKFGIEQLKKYIEFARSNGQRNHYVNRNFKCWQVKTDSFDEIIIFCDAIQMSRKAIIEFPKSDKTLYVVNLFHSNILEVVR